MSTQTQDALAYDERIAYLEGLVAVKDEALKVAFMELDPTEHGQNCDCDPDVGYVCPCCIWVNSDEYRLIKKAIYASPQQVSEWERKQLEPLRAQVAMLRSELSNCAEQLGWHEFPNTLRRVAVALGDTQATAEQFKAECEQLGAGQFKELLLEASKVIVHPHIEGVFAAYQSRATSKKAE